MFLVESKVKNCSKLIQHSTLSNPFTENKDSVCTLDKILDIKGWMSTSFAISYWKLLYHYDHKSSEIYPMLHLGISTNNVPDQIKNKNKRIN